MIQNLNMFDTAVILIMVLSCLIAFFRGFVREILSLGAWVGAGVVTLYYFPAVAEYVKPHVKSPVVAAGVGTLGIYITALLIFSTINWLILKLMKSGSDVGMLDNFLGLLFGMFRGAFIISLGFFILSIVVPKKEYPEWLKQSITRPYVEKGATALAGMAPKYLRELSSLSEEAEDMAEKRKQDPDYGDSAHDTSSSEELKEEWKDIKDGSTP